MKFSNGLLCSAGVEGDELNLSGELGGHRPTVLAMVCALMGSLRVLDLSSNKLGPEGCAAIAVALRVNSSLISLDLFANQIGIEGGVAIAEALKVNDSLTIINLDSNGIGPEACMAIAEALKINNTLASLNLEGNSIGKESCVAIAEALKDNNSLTECNLKETKLGEGDEGWSAIFDKLRRNKNSKVAFLKGYSQRLPSGDNTIAIWDLDRQRIDRQRIKQQMNAALFLFGRFDVDEGPPIYLSASSAVFQADEIGSADAKRALKAMRTVEQVLAELNGRDPQYS